MAMTQENTATQETAEADIIDLNAAREEATRPETVGQTLARAREAAKLNLADIVMATKIKQVHLEAIEASNMDALPAVPFTAGFIKVYATHLDLDAPALVQQFKDEVAAGAPPPEENLAAPATVPFEFAGNARLASLAGIAAIGLFAFWMILQVFKGPGDDASELVETTRPEVVVAEAIVSQPVPTPARSVIADEPAAEEMTSADVFSTEVAEPAVEEDVTAALVSEASADEPASEIVSEELPLTEEETTEQIALAEEAEVVPAPEGPVVAEATSPEIEADILAAELNSSQLALVTGDQTEAAMVDSATIETADPAAIIVAEATVPQNIVSEQQAPVAPALEPAIAEVTTEPAADEAAIVETAPQSPIVENLAPATPVVAAPATQPVIISAKVTRQPKLAYPPRCERGAANTETVTVIFDVTAAGRAANIGISGSSNNCFDKAAMSTVKRMRFSPRTVNGAVQVETGKTATLNFPKY